MRKLIVLVVFFSCFVSAQNQEATLHFKDGASIEGYGLISGLNEIKFTATINGQVTVWTGEIVSGITFHGFEYDVKFEYVKIKANQKQPVLLEILAKGEVTLYADISNDTLFLPILEQGIFGLSTVKSSRLHYYVKRENEEIAARLKGNFKKAIYTYFGECSGLKKRVVSHEFRWATMIDLVNYYNDFCAFD